MNETFLTEIIAGGVLVNLPAIGFIMLQIWKMDTRLVKIETKLEAIEKERNNEWK